VLLLFYLPRASLFISRTDVGETVCARPQHVGTQPVGLTTELNRLFVIYVTIMGVDPQIAKKEEEAIPHFVFNLWFYTGEQCDLVLLCKTRKSNNHSFYHKCGLLSIRLVG